MLEELADSLWALWALDCDMTKFTLSQNPGWNAEKLNSNHSEYWNDKEGTSLSEAQSFSACLEVPR